MHLLHKLCNFWTFSFISFASSEFSLKEKYECQSESKYTRHVTQIGWSDWLALWWMWITILLLWVNNHFSTQFPCGLRHSTMECVLLSPVYSQSFFNCTLTAVSTLLISFGPLCVVPSISKLGGGGEGGTNLKLGCVKHDWRNRTGTYMDGRQKNTSY
jgi:hypothetical protein